MSGPKDVFLWDASLSGFGVKVTPSGTKTYLVQYRLGGRGSATKRYTIGRHGLWAPAAARAEAERLLRLVSTGVDPIAKSREQQTARADYRFSAYADHFLRFYGQRYWRSGTLKSAESNLRRWVCPVLKDKPLPDITRLDMSQVFSQIPLNSPALPRNLFALLRRLFAYALENGVIEETPFTTMKSPPAPASRERVLEDKELLAVMAFSDDLGMPFSTFIKMLIITGQRRNEVSGMNWHELDRSTLAWIIPRDRTKNKLEHRLPINRIMLLELDCLAGGNKWPSDGFVFTTNGKSPISGYAKIKTRLDKFITAALPKINPWRFHDLRRTFATNMQRLGVRFEVTEALLNHVGSSRSGIAAVYQRHDWSKEKMAALESYAESLSRLLATGQFITAGYLIESDGSGLPPN